MISPVITVILKLIQYLSHVWTGSNPQVTQQLVSIILVTNPSRDWIIYHVPLSQLQVNSALNQPVVWWVLWSCSEVQYTRSDQLGYSENRGTHFVLVELTLLGPIYLPGTWNQQPSFYISQKRAISVTRSPDPRNSSSQVLDRTHNETFSKLNSLTGQLSFTQKLIRNT